MGTKLRLTLPKSENRAITPLNPNRNKAPGVLMNPKHQGCIFLFTFPITLGNLSFQFRKHLHHLIVTMTFTALASRLQQGTVLPAYMVYRQKAFSGSIHPSYKVNSWSRRALDFIQGVQLNLTPEMEVFYMLSYLR